MIWFSGWTKIAFATLVVMILGSLHSQLAFGQRSKPQTLPPVTPDHQFEDFEYRPELGGVLDKRLNVVWGYSYVQLEGGWTSYSYVNNFIAPNYSLILTGNGDELHAANLLLEAELYYAAAAAAAQYNNWRAPTLDEARSACTRGLFTFGDGGLNLWTPDPLASPGLPYDGVLTWTSTTEGKGKSMRGWAYNPADGGAMLTGLGSALDVILVRTHTP